MIDKVIILLYSTILRPIFILIILTYTHLNTFDIPTLPLRPNKQYLLFFSKLIMAILAEPLVGITDPSLALTL